MGNYILFVVLTFIIIIAVILIADNLTTAMVIMSLLASFLVVMTQFGKISKNVTLTLNDSTPPVSPSAPEEPEPNSLDLYGPGHEIWQSYKNSYSTCYDEPKPAVGTSCSERNTSIDASNALMAQHRARDKKCSDGWASKDANFYKHHFAHELDEVEAKPWWGNAEL